MMGTYLCGLQNMKPKACKIWPFKIFLHPKYGTAKEALYPYRDQAFYVYVDPACTGLIWGQPIPEFKFKTLPEFVDVALGLRKKQFHSTSKLHCQPQSYVFRGRRLI